MRTARVKGDGTSYYHCVSRIIQGQMLLDYMEKERFRKVMRATAAFSGVEILTYAIMTNHLHLLIKVPERREVPENEVLERIKILYDKNYLAELNKEINKLREEKREKDIEILLNRYRYRMYDLSQFMKTLLQRVTQSYNKRHERRGHLWENRFKSILIENKPAALSMMSAYIDLNCVRAGIADDPKEYRFCGYGEAVAGNKDARTGISTICNILGYADNWRGMIKTYRKHLFMHAGAHEKKGCTIDPEKIEEVIKSGGKLSQAELLHCRLRYLSDGVVLGSKTFVEDVFSKYRDEFGLKRKTGARKPGYGEWGGLCTMRNLRKNPVSISKH